MAVSTSLPSESLLVFSDVHLGSDIQEMQDAAVHTTRRSPTVDRDLVRLLAHYRAEKPPADRWRIVIAGDFIDFIGMTVAPAASTQLETALTEEEHDHGVGNAVDFHKVAQMERMAARCGKSGVGFTTTYRTWKDAAARQSAHGNVAVQTYIWIQSDPAKHLKVEG